MRITYKNKRLEKILIGINFLAAVVCTASFVFLFGFDKPLLPVGVLYTVQFALLFVFFAEKIIRLFNAVSKAEFLRGNWFEIPLLVVLGAGVFGAEYWFGGPQNAKHSVWGPLGLADAEAVRHITVGIYLVLQVVTKLCRTTINLAASGRNPTRTLIASFLFLIISGAGLLMLPKSAATETIGFVDALFTATSATCVTGLIVKDTGSDFSLMGQLIILSLIQLGGLGIVVFGAVFALLFGLSLRESVAMQDLLSARTLSRIRNMIAFIFIGTILIEAAGAVSIFGMWEVPGSLPQTPNTVLGSPGNVHQRWLYSIFHSISAFCNAGFSLFHTSFVSYNKSWRIYTVICPLIILGGLGFGVLYDLVNISIDRVKRFFKRRLNRKYRFSMEAPKRMQLQTKIVLTVSAALIVLGMLGILVFERYTGVPPGTTVSSIEDKNGCENVGLLGALFQSITARTAGFSTVNISAMSTPSKFILILLMFIGGSPGSTAGGIKTVTLAVVIMTVIAALRKRQDVEMFKRSIRIVVAGRAITVTLLFVVVLFSATLILSITENTNGFSMSDIFFEAGSALGTVGLTTGITSSLTTAGKLIIIVVMLVGRLGPLTLLAALTFNLKQVRYNYPEEAIVVG